MLEVLRSFWAPKTPGYEHEYEDSADWNLSTGVVAIADGVSSAIFSRAWAQILTTAVATTPPTEPHVTASLSTWLAPHRQSWSDQVELPKLKWNQVAKLNQVGGGWATLLWLHLEESPIAKSSTEIDGVPDSGSDPVADCADGDGAGVECLSNGDTSPSPTWKLTCHAIGDCNVFVVRDSHLQLSHPMQSSAAYAQNPQAVCSMNRGSDGHLNPLTATLDCQAGDTLFLCTDAVGQWIWSELEQNGEFDWQRLNNWSDEEWHTEVENLRSALRMPIDDCTLVIVRVGPSVLSIPASTESSGEVDPVSDKPTITEVAPVVVVGETDVPLEEDLVVASPESTLAEVSEDSTNSSALEIEETTEEESDRVIADSDSPVVESPPEE